MNRRSFIKGLSGSVSLLALPNFASAAALTTDRTYDRQLTELLRRRAAQFTAAQTAVMTLRNLHTDELLQLNVNGANQLDPTGQQALARFLRDHHTGEQHEIDPLLVNFLATVWRDIGDGGEIEIVSGYRSPKTNQNLANHNGKTAVHSFHMQGKAMDFCITGVPLTKLRDHAFNCQGGGVGFYPQSRFLHIDTGHHRFWGWYPRNLRDFRDIPLPGQTS